jgi:hypothetical protein
LRAGITAVAATETLDFASAAGKSSALERNTSRRELNRLITRA